MPIFAYRRKWCYCLRCKLWDFWTEYHQNYTQCRESRPPVCHTVCCTSCSLCRTPVHDWSRMHDVGITSHRGTTGTLLATRSRPCQVKSGMFDLPVTVWAGASLAYLADDCCLVSDSTRRSLWSADIPTCVVPHTLSSLETELLQQLVLVCGTHFLSSSVIQTRVQTTDEGTPFSGCMSTAVCDVRYVAP